MFALCNTHNYTASCKKKFKKMEKKTKEADMYDKRQMKEITELAVKLKRCVKTPP